jgi:crotonobetainyl-CoA:carnitine CoA-transferase CaiB-like acyl-CoA transferase
MTIPKISLHKSNIEQQHRPILDQPPADWIYDRDTPSLPLKFSRGEVGHASRVPLPREHNAEIYQGLLKLSNEELEALAKRRVV